MGKSVVRLCECCEAVGVCCEAVCVCCEAVCVVRLGCVL